MSRHAADDPIAWTTARCNRLLRPISSRLTTLRKQKEVPRPTKKEEKRLQGKGEEEGEGEEEELAAPANRRSWKRKAGQDDLEWIPDSKPQKTYKKYGSSRVGRPPNAPPKPPSHLGSAETLLAPTPIVARTLQQDAYSPQCASPLATSIVGQRKRKAANSLSQDKLKSIKKETAPDAYNLISGVFVGFEHVLEATARYAPAREKKGTRSLLSTCLRQVPAYIELEEHWQEEEEEDSQEDVSSRIYTQLEDHMSRDVESRQTLGEVVRAHAIKLVSEAMRDALLPPGMLPALGQVCKTFKAWDAGEELFTVYLMTIQPALEHPEHPSDNVFDPLAPTPLAYFWDYVNKSQSWSLFYKLIALLIRSRKLPLEWAATRGMVHVWAKVVKSINQHPSSLGPAFDLLHVVFLQSFGLDQRRSLLSDEHPLMLEQQGRPRPETAKPSLRIALNNTIDSLLTVLSCADVSGREMSEAMEKGQRSKYAKILRSICESLTLELDSRHRPKLQGDTPSIRTTQTERACALLVADTILEGISLPEFGSGSSRRLADQICLMRRLAHGDGVTSISVMDSMAKMVNSLCRSCSHVTQQDSFVVLRKLTATLEEIATSANPQKDADFLRCVAFNSAMRYSEETRDTEHFQYAKSLEQNITSLASHSMSRDSSDREHSDHPDDAQLEGYRWEEGLEEWIMCTPALSRRRAKGKTTITDPGPANKTTHNVNSISALILDDFSSPVAAEPHRNNESSEMAPPTPPPTSSPLLDRTAPQVSPNRHASPAVIIYKKTLPTITTQRPSRLSQSTLASLSPTREDLSSSVGSSDRSEDSDTSYSEDELVVQRPKVQVRAFKRKPTFAQEMRNRRAKRLRNDDENYMAPARTQVERSKDEDEISFEQRPLRSGQRSDEYRDLAEQDTSFTSISSQGSHRTTTRRSRSLRCQPALPLSRPIRKGTMRVSSQSGSLPEDAQSEEDNSEEDEDELVQKPNHRRVSRRVATLKAQERVAPKNARRTSKSTRARIKQILQSEMSDDELGF